MNPGGRDSGTTLTGVNACKNGATLSSCLKYCSLNPGSQDNDKEIVFLLGFFFPVGNVSLKYTSISCTV